MRIQLILAALVLATTACGGGDSALLSQTEVDAIASRPEVQRLRQIAERADTMLVSNYVITYRISAQGMSESDSITETMRCSGTQCTGSEGSVVSFEDLFNPEVETRLKSARFGSRGRFDAVSTTEGLQLDTTLSGITVTRFPDAKQFGLWGEYGYAAVVSANGPIAGRYSGVAFSGNFRSAVAMTFGDATGRNPNGLGSATWRGQSEAVSTHTFERRTGTARITIPDLSRPRVDAFISISGYTISPWLNMVPSRGRYESGYPGSRNYLVGSFHGDGHEETYGVFSTGNYVGAYGAKR